MIEEREESHMERAERLRVEAEDAQPATKADVRLILADGGSGEAGMNELDRMAREYFSARNPRRCFEDFAAQLSRAEVAELLRRIDELFVTALPQ